ncbi:hypothetical protein [Escherichia coli]
MFFIENEGQAVAGTDYWQSVQAQAGYVYLGSPQNSEKIVR